MKHKICWLVLVACFIAGFSARSGQTADRAKITVHNPRGIQPIIRKIPMAPRPDTLTGKTVYIVDTKYPRTREFVSELFSVLKERYPTTNWVLKEKYGGYMDDDPKLWEEIKKNAHGAIVLLGH